MNEGIIQVQIVMLGPPGSGKGTQAHILSEMYSIPVITTGDMLREAVERKTSDGELAKKYMEKGELVPDGIVNKIVEDRLNRDDVCKGFILDGYPRNMSQADTLEKILEEENKKLNYVIHVVLNDEKIIERLSNRRSCPNCGTVFHLKSNPPKEPGICDECGSCLVQRNDDAPNVIRNRLRVYREKTRPLLERYQSRGLVIDVPGDIDLGKLPAFYKKIFG